MFKNIMASAVALGAIFGGATSHGRPQLSKTSQAKLRRKRKLQRQARKHSR
jgi:hypothetical protein